MRFKHEMKIIQIIPNFGMGGAEIMCENLTYELIRQGRDVIVVSLYDSHTVITERLEKNNIDIRYLNKKLGLDISIFYKLISIFKKEKPDAIHTHLYAIKYAVPAAILSGVKIRVHTVHSIASQECTKLGKILNKIFFRFYHVVPVALSVEIQRTVVEEYHLPFEEVPIVYNGIDLSKCAPKENYDINGKAKILHIGRFMQPKNHKGLLNAFYKLHEIYPNCELQLIGDGPMKNEFEEYVQKNGLFDYVRFLGLQSNVYGYLHDADIFILPSLFEGMPMSLIEAMGTGLPIIATAVGGVPNMLKDHENAFLIEINEHQIVESLLVLLRSEKLREKIGLSAKDSSINFSSNKMAEGYVKIYLSARDRGSI